MNNFTLTIIFVVIRLNYLTETKKSPNKLPELQTEKKLPKHFTSNLNITSRKPVIRSPRSNPVTETPYADQTIQRWREKIISQSTSKSILSNLYFN